MTRLRPTAIVIAVATLWLPQMVHADGPLLIRTVVDVTFPQPDLSAVCGFAVYRHIEGVVDIALFRDRDGNPVHEIGTLPSLRNTFFSPATGKAVSYPGTGVSITDYHLDGTAVVTLDGFLTLVHTSGGAPLLTDVGRIVFTAAVVGTSSDGVPLTGPPIDVLFDQGVNRGNVLGACNALEDEKRRG